MYTHNSRDSLVRRWFDLIRGLTRDNENLCRRAKKERRTKAPTKLHEMGEEQQEEKFLKNFLSLSSIHLKKGPFLRIRLNLKVSLAFQSCCVIQGDFRLWKVDRNGHMGEISNLGRRIEIISWINVMLTFNELTAYCYDPCKHIEKFVNLK